MMKKTFNHFRLKAAAILLFLNGFVCCKSQQKPLEDLLPDSCLKNKVHLLPQYLHKDSLGLVPDEERGGSYEIKGESFLIGNQTIKLPTNPESDSDGNLCKYSLIAENTRAFSFGRRKYLKFYFHSSCYGQMSWNRIGKINLFDITRPDSVFQIEIPQDEHRNQINLNSIGDFNNDGRLDYAFYVSDDTSTQIKCYTLKAKKFVEMKGFHITITGSKMGPGEFMDIAKSKWFFDLHKGYFLRKFLKKACDNR